MPKLPTEDEIRHFAEEIGAVDENGRYTEPRAKLAAGAQRYAEEVAQLAEQQPNGTTAQQLYRLADELNPLFPREVALDLLVAIAPALVKRQGLQLNPKGTRTHE